MTKNIYFDMDGTIADFYGVENWLDYLMAKNPYPYVVAKPLMNMSLLARLLNMLQKSGYTVNIISWLAKNSDNDFDIAVTNAKIKWLHKHLPSVHWNEINIVSYGINKATFGNGILFDDEKPNRDNWGENAYDVHDIIEVLKGLVKNG